MNWKIARPTMAPSPTRYESHTNPSATTVMTPSRPSVLNAKGRRLFSCSEDTCLDRRPGDESEVAERQRKTDAAGPSPMKPVPDDGEHDKRHRNTTTAADRTVRRATFI